MYGVADQRPATGGTATTAGVLAVLGGLVGLGGVIAALAEMARNGSLFWWGIAPEWVSIVSALTMVVDIVAAVMLLTGAILLFRRRGAGPIVVALGCTGVVGVYVMTVIWMFAQLRWSNLGSAGNIEVAYGHSSVAAILATEVRVPWAVSVSLLVFPVVTFLLAVLPSTRRWCRRMHRPAGMWGPGAPRPEMQPYGMQPAMQRPELPSAPGYFAPQGYWGQPNHPPQHRPPNGYRH